MTDRTKPEVPPHVDRFFEQAREMIAVDTGMSPGNGPVRIKLRYQMVDGEWGEMDRTYTPPAKHTAGATT